MSERPMMECGCAANAHRDDGSPSCVVHNTNVVAKVRPSLEGRVAECAYGGAIVPSSFDLPFFEYHGPGSMEATEGCQCGYFKVAHEYDPRRVSPEPIKCRVGGFTPRGDTGKDRYYCGCRGWD